MFLLEMAMLCWHTRFPSWLGTRRINAQVWGSVAQGGGSGLRSRSPLDDGIGSLKGQLETIVMITLDYWQWPPLCSYSS